MKTNCRCFRKRAFRCFRMKKSTGKRLSVDFFDECVRRALVVQCNSLQAAQSVIVIDSHDILRILNLEGNRPVLQVGICNRMLFIPAVSQYEAAAGIWNAVLELQRDGADVLVIVWRQVKRCSVWNIFQNDILAGAWLCGGRRGFCGCSCFLCGGCFFGRGGCLCRGGRRGRGGCSGSGCYRSSCISHSRELERRSIPFRHAANGIIPPCIPVHQP